MPLFTHDPSSSFSYPGGHGRSFGTHETFGLFIAMMEANDEGERRAPDGCGAGPGAGTVGGFGVTFTVPPGFAPFCVLFVVLVPPLVVLFDRVAKKMIVPKASKPPPPIRSLSRVLIGFSRARRPLAMR